MMEVYDKIRYNKGYKNPYRLSITPALGHEKAGLTKGGINIK